MGERSFMQQKKKSLEFTEENVKKDMPLYTIGIVSELVGTTNQTLRLYEKHGLVNPARKNKNRFYSENDIRWLLCLRILIHKNKISIEGIKKLLEYAPCWEITACSDTRRSECHAFKNHAFKNSAKPCWELNQMICRHKPNDTCEECVVLLSNDYSCRRSKGNGNGSE